MRSWPTYFDIGAIVVALVLALIAPPAGWIERHYTNGFYLPLNSALRPIVDAVPISVADVLLLAFVVLLVLLWVRALRRPGGAVVWRVARAFLHTLGALAVVFIWFKVFWGFNYQRVPISEKVPVQAAAVVQPAVEAFANHVIQMLDANVDGAHAELGDRPDQAASADDAARERLAVVEQRVFRLFGDDAFVAMPEVKPTLFDPMMGKTGDTGFMDPWTHEVNLYSGQLPFERPSTFAHEWAHVAGFADEAEANYIAVLSCINSTSALARYSGWLMVWENMPRDVHVTQRAKKQVRDDVDAIIARIKRQVNRNVEHAQQTAYDRYLKANRVVAGIGSYQLFVRWMVGATYGPDGLPHVNAASEQGS